MITSLMVRRSARFGTGPDRGGKRASGAALAFLLANVPKIAPQVGNALIAHPSEFFSMAHCRFIPHGLGKFFCRLSITAWPLYRRNPPPDKGAIAI